MKRKPYEQEEVLGLLPLLASIGREIEERSSALVELESKLAKGLEDSHNLVAEAAEHRRGIRLARAELDRLGCSVLGTTPMTFRIPGRVGEANHSFVWQTGDPVLK